FLSLGQLQSEANVEIAVGDPHGQHVRVLNEISIFDAQKAADEADHLADGAVGSQYDSATVVYDHERRDRDEINVLKPPDLPLNIDAAAVVQMRAKGSDRNLDFLSPPAPGYRRHCLFPPGEPRDPFCREWEPQPCGRVRAELGSFDDVTTSPASRRLASAFPALAPERQLILARTLRPLNQ